MLPTRRVRPSDERRATRGVGSGPVLFRVAAGPTIGSGHLVRAFRLSSLIDRPAVFCVRGARAADLRVPLAVPFRVPDGDPRVVLERVQPCVLVVDDPSERAGRPWVEAARGTSCRSLAFADAGIGTRCADMVVDGSIARPIRPLPARRSVRGPAYAVVDPAIPGWRARRRWSAGRRPRVLISLGGGRRRAYARALAEAILRAWPEARVTIAGGFTDEPARSPGGRLASLGPQPSLVPHLASATIAVVAGGLTVYEACALGVPTVAVPVVEGQRPAVMALSRRGAVVTVGGGRSNPPEAQVAGAVAALIASPTARHLMARRAARLLDGHGAYRAAALLEGHAAGLSTVEILRELGQAQSAPRGVS